MLKPILVVSDNDLLLVGIERLIKKTADLPIFRIVSYDENEIIKYVQDNATEVVIVDGSFEKKGLLQLTSLLNAMKNMRLMVLGIDNNQILIYDKREVFLEHSGDFVSFI